MDICVERPAQLGAAAQAQAAPADQQKQLADGELGGQKKVHKNNYFATSLREDTHKKVKTVKMD